MGARGYILNDPRPLAAEAKYTFFLPSDAETAAVAKGDLVKLQFEHVPAGEDWPIERMWIRVEGHGATAMWGRLANVPGEPKASIRSGDRVAFDRHHILAIEWLRPDSAPAPDDRRTYWERCLVDRGIVDGVEPVAYLYREAPSDGWEGDDYTFSGWHIRGREVEDGDLEYIALGKVLNQDDSWLAWIDAPVGTWLARDFASNTYVVTRSYQ